MRQTLLYLIIFFLVSCGQPSSTNDQASSPQTDTFGIVGNNSLKWADSIYSKFSNFEHSFIKRDLREYSCSDLEPYFYDSGTKIKTDELTQVDTILCKRLFGNHKNEYGDFCGSYFFSIDRPIHNFYPITVIQGFGVAERPIVMVLFNNNGQIVNTLEVADKYGESGGCLSSKFINDSTLIQDFEWPEYGEDSVSGKEIWETSYLTKQVTITSTGQLIEKELKRWTKTEPYNN